MKREKSLEAILVITTGFLIIYLFKPVSIFLYVAVSVGFIGVFIKPIATLLAKIWFKIGDLLGFFVSKVVLAIVFYLLVFPISVLYRLFNGDTLNLKNSKSSLWTNREHTYSKSDLKNSW